MGSIKVGKKGNYFHFYIDIEWVIIVSYRPVRNGGYFVLLIEPKRDLIFKKSQKSLAFRLETL